MKRTQQDRRHAAGQRAGIKGGDRVRRTIAQAKEQLLNQFSMEAGEHLRVLRLALNEAEALAWHSEFPQLFFPELAAEKAGAAISWHRRQRALRRAATEVAFAE
jgi:hypothetical protein